MEAKKTHDLEAVKRVKRPLTPIDHPIADDASELSTIAEDLRREIHRGNCFQFIPYFIRLWFFSFEAVPFEYCRSSNL